MKDTILEELEKMSEEYITEHQTIIIRQTINIIINQVNHNIYGDYYPMIIDTKNEELLIALRLRFKFISLRELTQKKYKQLIGYLWRCYQKALEDGTTVAELTDHA